MLKNFYGCFEDDTCGSEDCSKFNAKKQRQKMLTTFNGNPDLIKKDITGDELQLCGYFRHETSGSEECSKIAKF